MLLFSSWDHWRHLCCHLGFGGSRLKKLHWRMSFFQELFLLIYCSGHVQRPPQASVSNGTGLWCSRSGGTLLHDPLLTDVLPRLWWLSSREHFGGRGFAPPAKGNQLLFSQAPSTGKLEPITKQLCYSLRKKQMDRGKREKMIITKQQQTELYHAPQREAAVLIWPFGDNWKFWPPSTAKIQTDMKVF